MESPNKNAALLAYWTASPDARKAILEQSDRQIQAAIALLIGLDQRLTQIASFMLAAAAVSAGLAYQIRDVSALAGIAAMAFAVAGSICFYGMIARSIALPGIRPSWWTHCDLKNFSDKETGYQIVGLNEDIISNIIDVKIRKSAAINLSLKYAIAGGTIVALSGYLAIFL